MSQREIDQRIRKEMRHKATIDEVHALEAKERVWLNIKREKRHIPWGLISALAASFLLLLGCGLLFLQLQKQKQQLNTMAAQIDSLKLQKAIAAKKALREELPTCFQEQGQATAPVNLKQELAKQQEHRAKDAETQHLITKARPEPVASKSQLPAEIPVPDISFPLLDMSSAVPTSPVSKELVAEETRDNRPKNKLKIRLGNKAHLPAKNESLALHIKL
ncbi:hypothetical protein [Cyclobacterium sp.]|uniref:hypothetical protein n=1 Tax=Cyclobacterium sp. TaxID=1966343 RepID=UPI0019C151B2|nr:hypothetical protein [Cyclobacterium sp.]MBD3627165.1 hypothetical protein [Cyclobacterium sp.]